MLAITPWFRPGISGLGSNPVAQIDEAARRAERVLLVLSPAYLSSDYAFSEWATAQYRLDKENDALEALDGLRSVIASRVRE